ncbi:MAG TPA: glycine oxidase ThiO [Gemmatimonadales bacterium]
MTVVDVLVVGGGIVGAAAARGLAGAGLIVELIDSGTEDGIATQASGGMLAPLAESGADDPLAGLSVRARDLYRELAPALHDETGIDVGLWSEGILKVAFTEEEEDAGRSSIAWQRQQGLNTDWLPASALRQQCPGLSPAVRGAVLAPEDGALDPMALLEALLVSGTKHGLRIARNEHVQRVLIEDGRVTGVVTDKTRRAAGAVVVAAGSWSRRIEGLPRPLSVEPVRGQMLAFDWPDGEPRAIVYSGRGYVLWRGAEAVAGSTMEHVGFDASVTDEGVEQVGEIAGRLYPALAGAPIRRRWAGLRPATPDGRPIIGPDPEIPGLWYATGHGRNGILLAGITGEILANLFTENTLEFDLSLLAPSRFWQD